MRRHKKILIGLVVLLLLIGVTGFFIAPPIVKSVMTEKLSEALKRPVSIRQVQINPFFLSITIRGLDIRERSGTETFLSFDELYVNYDSFSLLKGALIITDVNLIKPYVRVARNADATYNFSDLLNGPASQDGTSPKKAAPFYFSLNNIRIEGGSLDFWDGPKQTAHTVRDLRVSIPFIANIDHLTERDTQPVISATINGNPYLLQGKIKPFHDSLETDFDIDIKDLNLTHYLPYVPVDLNFRLLSGAVDAKLQFAFMQFRDKKPALSISGDVALKQLFVDDKTGRPLVRIPSLHIGIANLEPLKPLVQLGRVTLAAPEINVRRSQNGEINLATMIPAGGPQKKAGDGKQASAPLEVSVGEFHVEKGRIGFKDEQPPEPVSIALHDLALKAKNLSTRKDAVGNLDFSVGLNRHGRIAAEGPIMIDPLKAELALKLVAIDIRPFQGYFTDKVKVTVTSGAVNAEGTLGVTDAEGTGPASTYRGRLLISNFRSVDKQNAEDLLTWKSLFFSDVRAGYNPLSIDIRRIALADFSASIVVHEDGVLNLQRIFAAETPPASGTESAPAGQAAEMQREEAQPVEKSHAEKSREEGPNLIRIGAVTVQAGTIDFLDRFIKPNFSANFSKIGGRISGLSSITEQPADVELRAMYNHYMPAEITGKIHPLRKDLFVDIKAAFRDMDLSSASPYSGRYAGYAIQKGKLSFDLQYLVAKGKLEAENRVFIDQLTLGDKVDSPVATKLPVALAIALLKDRRGQINLDIPLTGSLDDPKFSLGRLIVQVIVNLISKAVTAPFSLIGGLVGGGEELGYVEFEYGRADLTDGDRKKIQTLAKALYERPALRMDIVGHVDLEHDREGLKRVIMERKVKARKFDDRVKQTLAVASVDDVVVEAGEYEKYLTQAYRAEPFPKPRTVIGLIKTLPVEEMEKLMLTHTLVGDDELRLLAARRVAVAREAIMKTGQVESERIFTVEPRSLTPEKKEKLKDSRVEFRLK